eukprot:scaffold1766_cov401-Prasinococcus_capsulatus_cf.AAC.22
MCARAALAARAGLAPGRVSPHHNRSTPGARRPTVPRSTASGNGVLRTPHSGYHFDGLPRSWFEGWYTKVDLPRGEGSFCIIYSVFDPGLPFSFKKGVGAQVLGPGEAYVWQSSTETDRFWGAKKELSLGYAFTQHAVPPQGSCVPAEEFFAKVAEGFQFSSTQHQGRIIDDSTAPVIEGNQRVETAEWDYAIKPLCGWGGDSSKEQLSCAGWLSSLPVFEPHWQVCMAHGLATGTLKLGDQVYEFEDAPAYTEKNWGGGFPTKWWWVQCNSFEGENELSVTTTGAKRGVVVLPGVEEEVAILGITYQGDFIPFVPAAGKTRSGEVEESVVRWKVAPWGSWLVEGKNSMYSALVEGSTQNGLHNEASASLRCPTEEKGMIPLCRDTFSGSLRVRVWRHSGGGAHPNVTSPCDVCEIEGINGPTGRGELIIDARSSQGALEVGGGPWSTTWESVAEVKEPLRSVGAAPVDMNFIDSILPDELKIPGL